jgi:GNAT superfamily N-acetyltransferase
MAFVARAEEWMARRLEADATWRCWVAETGRSVVGHLWLQLIEKVPNPGPELESIAYITNVYVQPEARGSGAGQMLVEAAMDFCREHAVDSAILWPTERSRTLYARHGFREPDDMLEAVLAAGRDLH